MSKGTPRPIRFADQDWPNMAACARGLNVAPPTIHKWIREGRDRPPQEFLDRRAREAGEEPAAVEEPPVAEEPVAEESAGGLLGRMSGAGKHGVSLDVPPWEKREEEEVA